MLCYDMFFVPKYVIVTTYTAAVKIASHEGFFCRRASIPLKTSAWKATVKLDPVYHNNLVG